MKQSMMENTPLFSVLTEEQRSVIADRMIEETRRAGEIIYQQGRPATALYLIRSGWARLLSDQMGVLSNVGSGSLLGETDLILGRAYSASAEAASDVSLWTLHDADIKAIFQDEPAIARALKVALGVSEDQTLDRHLRRLELMRGLQAQELRDVVSHLRPEQYRAGQTVYREGVEGDAMYLIDEGQVQLQNSTGIIATIGAGDEFGEGAFLTGDPRSMTATALTDVIAWSLNRADFEQLALRYPILALNLSRVVTRRLRERNLRVAAPVAAAAVAAPVAAATVVAAAPRPTPTDAETAGSLTALYKATAAPTASWWSRSSTGAKIRLVAVIVLLLWVLGAATVAIVNSLVSQNQGVSRTAPMAAGFQERAVLVALAADLPVDVTATYTPWPTETPLPTPTFTPTATPTNTPIPTATFTPVPPTDTPVPPTSTPVPTRVPVRAVARAAAAPVAAAAPAVQAAKAAAAPAPKPSGPFSLVEMRHLAPCENHGMHNIFVKVVDGGGAPVDGVVLVQSPAGQAGNVLDKQVSGSKGPGMAEFVMWKGAEYAVYPSADGANPTGDVAEKLHPNFPDEPSAECPTGNTLFHNSWSVVFRKNF